MGGALVRHVAAAVLLVLVVGAAARPAPIAYLKGPTPTTSTTSTTIAGPGDLFTDPNLVAVYLAEDGTPASNGLSDSHTNTTTYDTNDLTDIACASAVQDSTFFIEGTSSVDIPSSCQFRCDNGVDCTDADFAFDGSSDDFTVLIFRRETVNLGGTNGIIRCRGSDNADGWNLFVDSTDHICFQTGTLSGGSGTICDGGTIGLDTWYYIAAVYDGANDNAWIYRDGYKVADDVSQSVTMFQPGSNDSFYVGAGGNTLEGPADQIIVYAGRITPEWITYIGVCLLDKSKCTCDTTDPSLYASAPRWAPNAGPISGPMPDCDVALAATTIGTE